MKRALLLGILAIAAPALPVVLLAPTATAPQPRDWPRSPPEPPLPALKAAARWDPPAGEALARLRRNAVTESRRVVSALSACEDAASHESGAGRNVRYRKCATSTLARANGFGTSSSEMLNGLARDAGPARECRSRVMSLSGTVSTLAMVASVTLRTGLDAPWTEVLAASKAIRRLAKNSGEESGRKDWAAACKPRRQLPPPEGPVA